jgi:hypothetical protein
MTGKYKNHITGAASHWSKPAKASSRAYRHFDSRCDCEGHLGEFLCLVDCPYEHCLHDFESENESVTNQVVTKQIKKVSVYDGLEDYFNTTGR